MYIHARVIYSGYESILNMYIYIYSRTHLLGHMVISHPPYTERNDLSPSDLIDLNDDLCLTEDLFIDCSGVHRCSVHRQEKDPFFGYILFCNKRQLKS